MAFFLVLFIFVLSHKDILSPTLLIRDLKDDHVLPTSFLKLECNQERCSQNFTTLRNFRVHLEKMHRCKSVPLKCDESTVVHFIHLC